MRKAVFQLISRMQLEKEDNNRLLLATYADTPEYSLKGLKTRCKPLKIYDGDTLWIALFIEKKLRKMRVRMFGYDSAEMHGDTHDIAVQAQQHLKQLLSVEPLVDAEFFEFDKYGRPLVKLYVNNQCVNDQMIKSGFGKVYYGQTKEKW